MLQWTGARTFLPALLKALGVGCIHPLIGWNAVSALPNQPSEQALSKLVQK